MNLRWWGFLATLIAITGAAGIVFIITQIYPSPPIQGVFLFLLFITVSAAAIVPAAYFNHRFAISTWRKRDPNRLLRQGIEAGLLTVILTYLQWIRALDWTITAVLFGVFILMEMFFVTR